MIHRESDIKQPELDIYPLTIVCDRYTGTYSRGKYTAWNMDPWDLNTAIEAGDDGTCSDFWGNYTGIVGKGNTPDEALEDLALQLYKNKKSK